MISNESFSQKAILTSRWFHPNGPKDSVNTLEAIKAFKPYRIDWTYTEDVNITNIYRNQNLTYSLTLNPQYPDSVGYTTLNYRIRRLDGTGYTAPWMKSWNITNPYWGCVNNPRFVTLFFAKAEKLVKLGAYGILIDDALFNAQLKLDKPNTHGCFCDYCLSGYLMRQNRLIITSDKRKLADELKNNSKFAQDYENYQQESVVNFLSKLKNKLRELNPEIKFLANNGNGEWNTIYEIFDKGVAELSPKNLNTIFLASAYNLAASLKKTQLFTLVADDIQLQNWLIFYNYFKGQDYVIPWDILVDVKNKRRFYVKCAEYQKTMTYLRGQGKDIGSLLIKDLKVDITTKIFVDEKNNAKLIVLSNSPTKIPREEFDATLNVLMKNLNYKKISKVTTLVHNSKYAVYNLILK